MNSNSDEVLNNLKGVLEEYGTIINDKEAQQQLKLRGYGEYIKNNFVLKDYEALFLLYNGKLEISQNNEKIPMNEIVNFSLSRDSNAWTRFLIYRDLRSRGYIVKEGFGFGVDFRVYERGEFGTKPAKYVVCGINEGTKSSIESINEMVNQIRKMGKEAILAAIERRGEVIYYKIQSWKPFLKKETMI